MLRTFTLVLLCAHVALGCSCGPALNWPMCARIGGIKALFVGTPVESNIEYAKRLNQKVWYRFRVEEALLGMAKSTREVIVDPGSGGTCPVDYKLGRRYLVISNAPVIERKNPPGLDVYTSACTGSKLVEEASEELRFARLHKLALQPSRVFGSVRLRGEWLFWNDALPPVVNALVELRGPGGTKSTMTMPDGTYEFKDTGPGDYQVTVHAPGLAENPVSQGVEVAPDGCGYANIGIFPIESKPREAALHR